MKIFLLSIIFLTGSGCAVGVTQCLETPISNKVSQNAVETCQTALQANLDRQDLFYIYLGLLRVRQQYDEMVTWSQRILDQDPSRTDATYNLAFALRKKGNCAEAIKKYLVYAKANTEDPDPYYGLGLCFEDLGDNEQARQNYQAYLSREKRRSQQAWVENAQARIQALNKSPLASAPPQLTAAPPAVAPRVQPTLALPSPVQSASVPPAPAKLADCSPFEKTFTADPFALDAYDQFAQCTFQAGRYDELINRIRVALRDNPDFYRGWMHLGKALKATGDLTQSKIALAKACTAGVTEACGL